MRFWTAWDIIISVTCTLFYLNANFSLWLLPFDKHPDSTQRFLSLVQRNFQWSKCHPCKAEILTKLSPSHLHLLAMPSDLPRHKGLQKRLLPDAATDFRDKENYISQSQLCSIIRLYIYIWKIQILLLLLECLISSATEHNSEILINLKE